MTDKQADAAKNPAESTPVKHHLLKKTIIVIIAILLFAGLAIGSIAWWRYADRHPSTKDAYIHAYSVTVRPQVSGQVIKVNFIDNEPVKKGDVLFKIDPRPFIDALEKARAERILVEQEITSGLAKVQAAMTMVQQARAQLETAEFRDRLVQPMLQDQDVSPLTAVAARDKLLEARARLANAEATYESLDAELGDEKAQEARMRAAIAAVKQAELNLDWTTVRSPADGHLTHCMLSEGQYVSVGDRLFPIVVDGDWWVHANFKETDISRIKEGMPVHVMIDMYDGTVFHGTVKSLSVSSAASFSLLPPENTTGNWVKVTQRIPVRIRLEDQVPSKPYRVGASCEVRVNTDGLGTGSGTHDQQRPE
ncbi:MAG: hemolysin D [Phycisphaerae bacterium]|nr:hemolysin D [Phycisphaerae bacterium]